MKGPVAPKDPTKKRPKIYLMLETNIMTAFEQNGRYAEVIHLDGRVSGNVRLICPELPEDLAGRLQNSHDFFEIVHSVGVIIEAAQEEQKETEIMCSLHHYATTERFSAGTHMNMEVCADGAERVFPLSEFEDKEVNLCLGAMFFSSDTKDFCGKATIILYLQDGYEVPEPELDPPIDFESDEYRQLLERSLMSLGNTHRLRKVIEKAERGEEVTIAFIGGSITQGAGAKPIHTESYAYRIYDAFAKNYATRPEQVRLIKAGIGGTPSELGLLRYEKDILRDGEAKPDLVIIEFAVNDAGDETNGICYESLVAKAYNQPEMPAVLLLFAVFMNDWNLQDRLRPIGDHYQLPMVSVLDAVSPQFGACEDHVLSKRQYFHDLYHPTNDGHRVMADCVMHLIEQSLANIDEECVWPEDACLGREYEKTVTIYRAEDGVYPEGIEVCEGSFGGVDNQLQWAEFDKNPHGSPCFPYNWARTPENGTDAFSVRLTCRSFFFIFKDSGDSAFGKLEVLVDGKPAKVYDTREVGWNHCNAVLIIPDGEAAMHEITVRPTEDSVDKCGTILAFSYVR